MTQSLRELAHEYAKNTLDKGTYRQLRGELIRGICSHEIEVEEHEYPGPAEDTLLSTVTGMFYPKTSASLAHRENLLLSLLSGKGLAVMIAIVLLLALGFTTIFKMNATKAPPAIVQTEQHLSPGQRLVNTFALNGIWTDESMQSFIEEWRALPEQDREATIKSQEMKQFTNRIYKQLINERALISLGDTKSATMNQKRLVDFAAQMDIDDERLSVYTPERGTPPLKE